MSSHPSAERHCQLLAKYCVPNMGDYSAVGSTLSSILERLDTNRSLSVEDKKFIRDKGMFDHCRFVEKLEATGVADFGILRAKAQRQQTLAVERELRDKYEIDYFEYSDKRRLMELLRSVDRGGRLTTSDVVWLTENDYFTQPLKVVFHEHEAMFHRRSFEQSNNPWDAVNASSHYRKASLPSEALTLLAKVRIGDCRDRHLKSALCTTTGGALRDLKRFDEALASADNAHAYDQASFHPCTLLGALYYELGNHALGDEWFAKAVERGAAESNVDDEIRSIFRRTRGADREAIRKHLLNLDPKRYAWVNEQRSHSKRPPGVTNVS